jgi:replication-associated recombination protein RarA
VPEQRILKGGDVVGYQIKTIRGYPFGEVASALQKAIRRADARLAGYWTIELFESGFTEYLWRRLLTISAEDCWGVITHEIEALYRSWQMISRQKKGGGRVFAAKAAILLSMARKSRDADHLTNLVYDPAAINTKQLEASLEEVRRLKEAVPDYALDCHTYRGKSAGKTRKDFFLDEHGALKPKAPGLFDQDIENLK